LERSNIVAIAAIAVLFVGAIGGTATYLTRHPSDPVVPVPAPVKSVTAARVEKPKPIDLQHERWLRMAEDAHALFDEGLPDYPSTRFKDVRGFVYGSGEKPKDYVLCGKINAKNRLGAYRGYRQFSISYNTSGSALRAHFQNDDDWIVRSYCEGKGTAGEKMAAENRKLEGRPLDYERDIRPLLQELAEGRVKPAPVLKHSVSKADYTEEISYSHKVGTALSNNQLWP